MRLGSFDLSQAVILLSVSFLMVLLSFFVLMMSFFMVVVRLYLIKYVNLMKFNLFEIKEICPVHNREI